MPGKAYIEEEVSQVAPVNLGELKALLEALTEKAEALIVFEGAATADGAADGSTLLCGDLVGEPDYENSEVVITSGTYAGQARGINATTLGGVITPDVNFDGQILSGVTFAILAVRSTSADVTSILALVTTINTTTNNIHNQTTDIKIQTDKSAGLPPVVGATVANWNAAEADIVTVGVNDTNYKLNSVLLDINALVGTVTIRLYMQVNGVERRVYEQNFTVAADGPGLWIVNGTVGIHEALRITAQSNNGADDGQSIGYDYMLEEL